MKTVAPRVLEHLPAGIKNVEIQMDGAGGHGFESIIEQLQVWADADWEKTGVWFTFVKQPARSPDFNVLDLGAWTSLQSRVELLRYSSQSRGRMVDGIVEAVDDAWDNWEAAPKLTNLYSKLSATLDATRAARGGNMFSEPRGKI
jgi:hypothetical protein